VGHDLSRALWLGGLSATHRAKEPHYYLRALGIEPALQGRGLGSMLLRPVLERCDREGVGACLEASEPRNVSFYQRHGFDVVAEAHLPRGGPPIWFMSRPPQ
jgi:GNAT superfamily N-acetyltransferase